jgi:hypothetical protein
MEFEAKTNKLFDVSVPDKQQNPDRLNFLNDQRGPRQHILFGCDPETEKKQERRQERKEAESGRIEKENVEKSSRFETKEMSDSEEDEG